MVWFPPSGMHILLLLCTLSNNASVSSLVLSFSKRTPVRNMVGIAPSPSIVDSSHTAVEQDANSDDEVVEAHTFRKLDVPMVERDQITKVCSETKVVATFDRDEYVILSLPATPVCDDATRRQRFDLAEDRLIAHCGSCRVLVRIGKEHLTTSVERLFRQKQMKNTTTKKCPVSSMLSSILNQYLAKTCSHSLMQGETIDVVAVSQYPSPIDIITVTFVFMA